VSDDVGRVLGALGDDTRRSIIGRLASGATPTATELAAELPISRQAVAKHLRVLEEARLVSARRSGREARYELTPAALADAATWIDEVSATWDRRLARLKEAAEAAGEVP
jgi:DNA-binding transcriptional ArsR family regulator